MKIKLESIIKDLDDKPVLKNKDESGEPMTLKDVILTALMTPLEQDKELDGNQKAGLFSLALSIKTGADELTAEDIALVKSRIGKLYTQIIVGRAFELIEG